MEVMFSTRFGHLLILKVSPKVKVKALIVYVTTIAAYHICRLPYEFIQHSTHLHIVSYAHVAKEHMLLSILIIRHVFMKLKQCFYL